MLNEAQLTNLRALSQPHVAEILKVYWDESDSAQDRFYAVTDWQSLGNFRNCSYDVEARLITPKNERGFSTAHSYELNANINSQTVQFVFSDTDQVIKNRFLSYGSNVKCEIIYYFPQLDVSQIMWFGHLEQPRIYGLSKQSVTAQNGFRSREFLLPSEVHMKECSARVFSGKLQTQEEIDVSICPYNKHLGGAIGVNNPVTSAPYTFCPKLNKQDCIDRLGTGIYWPGYDYEASGTTVSSRFITSKTNNNDSLLRFPIEVVWGAKIRFEMPVLQYYTRQDPSNPNRGTIHIIAEVSNDEVDRIFNVLFNGTPSNVQSSQIRTGQKGQSPTSWVTGITNYSGRSIVYLVGNYSSNPGTINISSIKPGCYVHGFKNGRIYSDETTYTQAVNNSRTWAVLELYTNNRWGLGYRHSQFDIQSFVDLAAWCEQNVRFTLTMEDGTVKTYDLAGGNGRTIFDAVMAGRPAAEQITDICRTGRFSVPFQRDGKYTVSPLAEATSGELSAARVFSDAIGTGNIIRPQNSDGSYQDSLLEISSIDPKDLPNTVVVQFEWAEDNDNQRPITCDDPNQMAIAGKILGSGGFKVEKRSVIAYGVRRLEEAIKYGYSVLWFGEFDQGGTKNNLRAEFTTTLRQAIDLKTYQLVKLVSKKLDGFLTPEGNPFEYFRVQNMRVNPDLSVTVSIQAYNPAAYANFETVLTGGEPPPTEPSTAYDLVPAAPPEQLSVSAAYSDGYVEVTIT